MIYIGIDPGKSGGVALIKPNTIEVYKMPDTDSGLLDLLLYAGRPTHAMLERVHAMPKQGVTSVFTFGEGFGKLQMALCAATVPYEMVTPQKWQKALSVSPRKTGGDKGAAKREHKNKLLQHAQRLFPKVKLTLATADALLIALYCKRFHEGTL